MDIETPQRLLVLALEPSGESFLKISGLSPDQGFLMGLKRISRKASSSVRPDLFDEAEVLFQRSRGNQDIRFIQDYRILHRYATIGDRYDSLREAARFTKLLLDNGSVLLVSELFYEQVKEALQAFAALKCPQIVHLKSLYRFLRDEGFPIKESWWPTLPASDRAPVAKLINQPIPETVLATDRQLADDTVDHLRRWMQYNTELIVK